MNRLSNFETSISKLSSSLRNNFSCPEAHNKMTPPNRYRGVESNSIETSKPSAVMILLYPLDGIMQTIFIKRPTYNGPHSNQVSLPGGKFEITDIDLQTTALRETYEEIGVAPEAIEVIGKLTPLYIPHSNYLVIPFIGYSLIRPSFIPDKIEVESLIEIPIEHLADETKKETFILKREGFEDIEAPFFNLAGEKLWGATAMIIAEFMELYQISTKK